MLIILAVANDDVLIEIWEIQNLVLKLFDSGLL